MRQLRLVAVSVDGAHLILSDGGDEQLVLQVDERLHAAIRGDRARLGQLDIQLESQLRPRDIQARIRAGESVESVAAMSGMPLDKVERFAGPVIAERQHIADRARQATVRRSQGEGKPPTLESAVADSAKAHGVHPSAVEWDSWRRDDGRWAVRCSWTVEGDDVFATFSFEPTGRSVTPEDDAARLLAGEIVPRAATAPDLPHHQPAPNAVEPDASVEPYYSPGAETDVATGPARLSVVPKSSDVNDDVVAPTPPVVARSAPETPVPDDAASPDLAGPADRVVHRPAAGDDVRRTSRRPTPYGRNERRRRPSDQRERGMPPTPDPTLDDEPTSERLRLSDIATRIEGPATDEMPTVADDSPALAAPAEPAESVEPVEPQVAAAAAGGPAEQPKQPVKRTSKKKRPSVPSWDEIMFGRGKPD